MAAEISRLFSRRFVLIALLLTLLGLAALQLATYFAVRPPSRPDVAQAHRYYEQARTDWQQHKSQIRRAREDCLKTAQSDEACPPAGPPQLAEFLPQAPNFSDWVNQIVPAAVVLLGLVFLAVGASFIGGEYTTSSLATWLTFVPQRSAVYWSKIIALATGTLLTGLIGLGALAAGMVAQFHVYGQPTPDLAHLASMTGRSLPLMVILALTGFAVALLTRHTVGAIALVLGYLLIRYVLEIIKGDSTRLTWLIPWFPETNLLAFLRRGHYWSERVPLATPRGEAVEAMTYRVGFGHSALYWAVVLAVILIGPLLVFRRRDVA